MSESLQEALAPIEELELEPNALADLIGVSRVTAKRWLAGSQRPNARNRTAIEAMEPTPPLGTTVLKAMLRSPMHGFFASRHLNPQYVERRSAAMDLGTVAHRLVLEPHKDHSELMEVLDFADWRGHAPPGTVVAGEEVPEKTRKTALRDMVRDAGRVPLLQREWDEARRMADGISAMMARTPGCETVGRPGKGEAEVPVTWAVRDGGRPVICRGRVDWVEDGRIVDLKTTARSAEPEQWTRTNMWWDVAVQLAFYCLGLEAVDGAFRRAAVVVAERSPPWGVVCVEVPEPAMDIALAMVRRVVRRYRACWEDGEWPGYESPWPAEPPSWAMGEEED